MQRIGGARRKTRSIMRKPLRERGKLSVSRYFQKYSEGDKVCLKAEPSVQKGIYFRRFHGKTGIIESKRGNCYNVRIKDINKEKVLIIHPIHLKKLQ